MPCRFRYSFQDAKKMTASNLSADSTPSFKKRIGPIVDSVGSRADSKKTIPNPMGKDLDSPARAICREILAGFKDIKEGRYIRSTGDWEKDKALFRKREREGWR